VRVAAVVVVVGGGGDDGIARKKTRTNVSVRKLVW
jgi:hypothetical protein